MMQTKLTNLKKYNISNGGTPFQQYRSHFFMGTNKNGDTVFYNTVLCSKETKSAKNEIELNKKYTKLFGIIHSNADLNEHTINEYYNVKNQSENTARDRTCGINLRSKVQWTEEGDKHTSYFLRLGKNIVIN